MSSIASKTPPHLFSGPHYAGMRIGLLGGSFNPAHEGHIHISLLALKKMRLHQVWWLVSPQNPLKAQKGMAGLNARLDIAKKITATHPHIIVSDLESQLHTRFTADTLAKLKARFPRTEFVWMMGADNLIQLPQWERWHDVFDLADIAVFRRPPYAVGVLRGLAAQRFSHKRIDDRKAALIGKKAKKWVLFANKLNALSATQIREGTGKK